MNIRGVYTALVTPFRDGQIDYPAMQKLLEAQAANGVKGVIPLGTTGESPTLSMDEHIRLIDFVCRTVGGRMQVIAGTGANATEEAIELTCEAKKSGAHATLQVTPYYNRPSQEGIYRHMSAIAEQGGLPIMLYNIPGRTGTSLELSTVERMVKTLPIVAIKEAAGSVERVSGLKLLCPNLSVVSGDDGLTLPMLSLGADGVVSVASNILPAEMVRMVESALSGDFKTALSLHHKLYDLFKHLFIETNPVPVKTALAAMGWMEEEFRLPLCSMSEPNRAILMKTLVALRLVQP